MPVSLTRMPLILTYLVLICLGLYAISVDYNQADAETRSVLLLKVEDHHQPGQGPRH